MKYFTENPVDVFVGIDAPDFNLRLELDLKKAGTKTVHYVSPSVWAWRQKRIHGIAEATNLVLAFLPFEKAFYDKFNVPCEFVGHTLADAIPLESDKGAAQELLGLDKDRKWLAVLPGSRGNELKMLSQPFIETCLKLSKDDPTLGFVVAAVNDKRKQQFIDAWQQYAPELDFHIVQDTARNVITASDAVLLASGTVALECMLLKRPMVVGYKMNAITAFLAKRLVKTKYVSLPNILADDEIVKEFLLEACTPENLHAELTRLLSGDNRDMIEKFTEMHHWIRKDADKQAADAVLKMIDRL
ncbi:lipid-A-disaccharide synthase [Vibrio variabilis]|uniref:Lipid-A-disaccharide synthase n=1 Tax=Vibrio variabilis TaxID=990271 RepID=A0ABQ0J4I3_9VIBR|nr:lipid-A-disaccharide synthase [Vibrio variabilis]